MNNEKFVFCSSCGIISKEEGARKEGDGKVWFQCPGCGKIAKKFESISREDPDFTGSLQADAEIEKKLMKEYDRKREQTTWRWRFKNLFHHKKSRKKIWKTTKRNK